MYLYTCLHCFKCNIRCLNRPVRDATIKKSSVELKFSLTVKKDDLFFSGNAVRQVCYNSVFVSETRDNFELITEHKLIIKVCKCLQELVFV